MHTCLFYPAVNFSFYFFLFFLLRSHVIHLKKKPSSYDLCSSHCNDSQVWLENWSRRITGSSFLYANQLCYSFLLSFFFFWPVLQLTVPGLERHSAGKTNPLDQIEETGFQWKNETRSKCIGFNQSPWAHSDGDGWERRKWRWDYLRLVHQSSAWGVRAPAAVWASAADVLISACVCVCVRDWVKFTFINHALTNTTSTACASASIAPTSNTSNTRSVIWTKGFLQLHRGFLGFKFSISPFRKIF